MARARAAAAAAVMIGATVVGLANAGGRATTAATPQAGGAYRVAFERAFGFTDNLDPTGEYFNYGGAILSNLLVRTLVGYNHVAGTAGSKLVPDLATAVPGPSNGGRTYTFHLKQGVKFGPPLHRAVTSKDVLYAFERLGRPKNGAQYAFYYSPIVGFDAYAAGKATTIAGIETPDAATIAFHLSRPTGDFPYRLALAAAAPLPREVAGCFDAQPGRYGKDIVSTGPYMLEGADRVDASSCKTLKAMSGW